MSTRLHTKRYKFENNRRILSKLPSANLQVTCAPASCSLAPQNPSQLHKNCSLINSHCWTLRFDMTANYQVWYATWIFKLSDRVRATMQHLLWEGWYYCFWSIDTDWRFALLVLTRKQKAIARPSVSLQQGGPGFQVRILLTFAVSAAVTLFVQPLG